MPCGSQDSAACQNWALDQREMLFQASKCHRAEFRPEQPTKGVGQRHSEPLKLQKGFKRALEKGFLHWAGSGEVTSGSLLTPESVILRGMETPPAYQQSL